MRAMISGDAYVDADASCSEIVASLDQHGITVLPGFLSGQTLSALKSEFSNALSPDDSFGRVHAQVEAGITVSLKRKKLPQDRFAAIYELFSSDWMKNVADQFYGTKHHDFNKVIFANENYGVSAPLMQLPFIPHFDKRQTLKFFVYLTDTSEKNGAMGVQLGSHRENRKARENELKRTGSVDGVQNVKHDVQTIPVEGPEGTLFIFDTDLTHNAGQVHRGNRRRILRGHTRPLT